MPQKQPPANTIIFWSLLAASWSSTDGAGITVARAANAGVQAAAAAMTEMRAALRMDRNVGDDLRANVSRQLRQTLREHVVEGFHFDGVGGVADVAAVRHVVGVGKDLSFAVEKYIERNS